jgi:hypothetical protein
LLTVGLTFVSPALALTPDQIAQQQQEQARQAEAARRESRESERVRL